MVLSAAEERGLPGGPVVIFTLSEGRLSKLVNFGRIHMPSYIFYAMEVNDPPWVTYN
jgi:hypothetical protein